MAKTRRARAETEDSDDPQVPMSDQEEQVDDEPEDIHLESEEAVKDEGVADELRCGMKTMKLLEARMGKLGWRMISSF